MIDYELRKFGTTGDVITTGVQLDTVFPFAPADFFKTMNLKESMTTPQLNAFVERQTLAGDEKVVFFEVEKHRRTAEAFSAFIFTLIGASIGSRKVRGGTGLNLVIGIGIALVYILIMKFSITFATNASLPPLVATWIPNLVFGVIALVILRRAPK
jgi:lipopolysaccharide export system permease protein